MGFLDSLLGSDSEVDYEQMSNLSPQQSSLMNKYLMPYLRSTPFGQYSGPEFTPSSGRLAPGLTSGQLTSLAALEQGAMNSQGLIDQSRGELSRIIGSGSSGSKEFEDFYQAGILDPALTDFSQRIQPTIGRQYAESGFFGTNRRQADERAGKDLMDTLLKERTRLALGSREQALNAMGMIGELGQAERDPLLDLLRAGEYQRGAEMDLTNAEKSEFIRRYVDAPNIRMQQLFQMLGIPTFQNFASVKPGMEGMLQSGLNAFLGGFGSSLG